jgi:hypothetical protein
MNGSQLPMDYQWWMLYHLVRICSILLTGKFDWCYFVKETTKYWSVMEQTQNGSFHMNWPTGDEEIVLVWSAVGY